MRLLGTSGKISETYTQGKWEIENFSSLSQDKDCYYNSPTFNFAESVWYLRIFAGGHGKKNRNFLSLYLIKKRPAIPQILEYTMSVQTTNGLLEEISKHEAIFKGYDSGWGCLGFFERSELLSRKSELLPSDVLTIVYTIKLVQYKTLRALETLSENFEALLDDKQDFDTTLKVKKKVFRAHKLVLAARSSVFRAMFQHQMSEKETGVVYIPDCDPNSFGDFLRYLYSGRVEDISFQSALHLYTTSDKYNVAELKSFCVKYMKNNLTVENLCDVVILANRYDEAELLFVSQDFFNQNLRRIVVTTEWETLMKNDHRLANQLIIKMSSELGDILMD